MRVHMKQFSWRDCHLYCVPAALQCSLVSFFFFLEGGTFLTFLKKSKIELTYRAVHAFQV